MKPPRLSRKVRRALSVDESLRRYLDLERKYLQERLSAQLRVLAVYQVLPSGDRLALPLLAIFTSPNGFVVEVGR